MITNITWPLLLLAEYRTNQRHTLQPEHNWKSPTCLRSIPECQVGRRKLSPSQEASGAYCSAADKTCWFFEERARRSCNQNQNVHLSTNTEICSYPQRVQFQSSSSKYSHVYCRKRNMSSATKLCDNPTKRKWNASGWQHMVLTLCARHKRRSWQTSRLHLKQFNS